MKYQRRLEIVDAFQLTHKSILASTPKEEQVPDWIINDPRFKVSTTDKIHNSVVISFAEVSPIEAKHMYARASDWIVKTNEGFRFMTDTDFKAKYESVNTYINGTRSIGPG